MNSGPNKLAIAILLWDCCGGHWCHFYLTFNPTIFTMSARILRANGFNISGHKFKGFAATLTHFMQRITATITCFIRISISMMISFRGSSGGNGLRFGFTFNSVFSSVDKLTNSYSSCSSSITSASLKTSFAHFSKFINTKQHLTAMSIRRCINDR